MSGNVFLDIETGRDDALTGEWIASRHYSAPSNYKKPEAIATNIADQKSADKRKAALNPLTLAVRVVSYAVNDGKVQTFSNHGLNEREVLTAVFEMLASQCQTVITFNGSEFDLPALRMRGSLRFGLRVPHVLSIGQKPWDQSLQFDLRTALTDGSRTMKGTLSDFCRYAKVPGPLPHTGEQVATMIEKQDWKGLTATCEQDVKALRGLYQHAVSVGWI